MMAGMTYTKDDMLLSVSFTSLWRPCYTWVNVAHLLLLQN